MPSSIQLPKNVVRIIWIFHMFSMMMVSPSLCGSRASESRIICEKTAKDVNNSTFSANFETALQTVKEQIATQSFGASSVTDSEPNVYVLGECHKDLTTKDCEHCFTTSSASLNSCLPATAGRIYLDGCFLRYGIHDFFKEYVNASHDFVNCSEIVTEFGVDFFHNKVKEVIKNVTIQAKSHKKFGTVEGKEGVATVYALAQCWETVDDQGCSQCLDTAGSQVVNCTPSSEGRALFTGCYLRYSTERFFTNNFGTHAPIVHSPNFVVEIVLLSVAFALLSGVGAFIGFWRLSQRREEKNLLAAKASSLNFKYEVLEKATDSFHESNKLGQGGAGSVFKGTLPNGKDVAVKRLFFNTRQWADQFFNEVNSISGIQHKNLVRLLGCSIEGPESLLIYEYVPNKSLDHILFDKNTVDILTWQQRFGIICGTAEGIAYLHGGAGSETKIIHRDIKSSNILLDENFTPKIADFGLVRCVSSDKTHVSTGIAGTLGYMAPEYLVRGQLTEKADVYSFGVLVIEIASGRKNSVFSEGSSSVLHNVWKHYKANRITQSVDGSLNGRFPEEEASRVLQIGLVCTQASVSLRPTMSEVVEMLNNEDCTIPFPKQPPFLNASVLSPSDSTTISFTYRSIVNTSQEDDSSTIDVPERT